MNLDKKTHEELIAKMGRIFGPLTKDQSNEYFEILKNWNSDIVRMAADDLIKNHPVKSFPVPADFIQTLSAIAKDQYPEAHERDTSKIKCKECGGIGRIIVTRKDPKTGADHDVIRYCDCWAGMNMKLANQRYFDKKKMRLK